MKTYFLSRFDLDLQVGNERISLKNGDVVLYDGFYSGDISVNSKDRDFDSYSFCYDECVNGFYDFVCCKKLSGDSWFFELKPKHVFNPCKVVKKIINFEKQIYMVESYNSNIVNVYTPNQKYSINKAEFIDFNYEIKEVKKKIMILCFNYEYCKHYFIFDTERLLFNGQLKEINIKDNHLILLKDDISCYGQKMVIDINLQDNTEERYFVYADNRKFYEDIDILYLFLDAVKIKNYDICKQYLSAELCDIDKDSLFDFFDDFEEYMFIEKDCILEKNNEVTKVVHFDVLNDKIVNIYD